MANVAAPLSSTEIRRPRVLAFLSDQRKWVPYLFVAPFFITFAIFTFYPMLRAIVMGFQESVGYSNQWEWVGLKNYIEALTNDRQFKVAAVNFVIYTLGSLITQIPAGLLLAWMLTSRSLRYKGFFRTLFFIPSVLPGVTVAVVGAWFFSETRGLANAIYLTLGGASRIKFALYPEFILPMLLSIAFWQWMGNHAIFFVAGMSGIDTDVIEASIVDGATPFQRFRYIVLPLILPVIAYVSITITAGSLTVYDIPYIFLNTISSGSSGGPGGQGWFFLPYMTWSAFDQMRMGYAAAMGWIVFVIAVVVTVIQLKLFNIGEVK
jgi:ABC-type sugar transport system permease subunit